MVMQDAAVIVAYEGIDDAGKSGDFDGEAGFLAHLAPDRVFDGFAPFDLAAGDAPFILPRRLSASNEEHAIAVPDNCTRSHDRAR
jgi:hypothetical protein